MSAKKRKPCAPRRLVPLSTVCDDADSPGTLNDNDRRDSHVCGTCCSEFHSIRNYLEHKRHCPIREWPEAEDKEWEDDVVSDEGKPASSTSPISTSVHNNDHNAGLDILVSIMQPSKLDEMSLSQAENLLAHADLPEEVQSALLALRQQQQLQLQMIRNIYVRLCGSVVPPTDSVENSALLQPQKPALPGSILSPPSSSASNKDDANNSSPHTTHLTPQKYLEGSVSTTPGMTAAVRCLAQPYRCHICNHRYATRENLKVHLVTRHRMFNGFATMPRRCRPVRSSDRPHSYPTASSQACILNNEGLQRPRSHSPTGLMQISYHDTHNLSDTSSPSPEILRSPTRTAASREPGCDDNSTENTNVAAMPFFGAPMANASFFPSALSGCGLQNLLRFPMSSLPRYTDRTNSGGTSEFRSSMLLPAAIRNGQPASGVRMTASRGSLDHDRNSPSGPKVLDEDWESMMEIDTSDEAAKLQKLVGNIDTSKVTDPNQCVICHRILSCKSALQMHYRTHTGERPFRCKICMRAFTTKGNLKTHMGVHRIKPPLRALHQCPVCHKKFTNNMLMQQHLKVHREEPTPLSVSTSCTPNAALPLSTVPINATYQRGLHVSTNFGDADPTQRGRFLAGARMPCTSPLLSASFTRPALHKTLPVACANVPVEAQPVTKAADAPLLPPPKLQNCLDDDYSRDVSEGDELINGASDQENLSEISSPVVGGSSTQLQKTRDDKPSPTCSPSHSDHSDDEFPTLSGIIPKSNPFCSVMLPTPQQVAMMSGRPNTTCNICFKTFACNSALDIHYRSHTKERPFKCHVCTRGFSTKGNMKQHLLTHKIRDLPPTLDLMTAGGPTKTRHTTLDGHTSTSHYPQIHRANSLPAPVTESNARVVIPAPPSIQYQSDSDDLSMDSASCNGDPSEESKRPVAAAVVQDTSAKKQSDPVLVEPLQISDEMTTTTNPLESMQKMWAQAADAGPSPRKPPLTLSKHQCQVCYKHFSSASALQIHSRTHSGEKPFKCTVCDRAFTTKGNLKVHMGTHVWNTPVRRGRRGIDMPFVPVNGARPPSSSSSVDPSPPPSMSPLGKVTRRPPDTKERSALSTPSRSSTDKPSHMMSPYAGGDLHRAPMISDGLHGCPTYFRGLIPGQTHGGVPFTSYPPPAHSFMHPFATPAPPLHPNMLHGLYSGLNAHLALPFNLPVQNGGPGSMEAAALMLNMWRCMCSVCHKVCASPKELEEHLKAHLRQTPLEESCEIDRATAVSTVLEN